MIRARHRLSDHAPALLRLSRLAKLQPDDLDAIAAALLDRRSVRIRREMIGEGQPVEGTRLIAEGWAARVHLLGDGRRQFLGFLLPGDFVGLGRHPRPLSTSTVIALTDVVTCPAPPMPAAGPLADAYAISRALDEAHLLGQVTRLGRMTAQERIGDLFLELHERLSLAGLVTNDSFSMPLTQELLADTLGLTAVHVNRMLQNMRRAGDIEWKGRVLTLPDPADLARKVGRVPVQVSAPHP